MVENGDSKDVLPENVGTEPISSSANLAGLENEPEPALQMPQGQHCKSRTSGSANLAPPALQISQGCIYKDKTLQVNPPSEPSLTPFGRAPRRREAPRREGREERDDGTGLRSRGRDGPSRVRPLQAGIDHGQAGQTGLLQDRESRRPDRRSPCRRPCGRPGAHPRGHRLAASEPVLAPSRRLRSTPGRQLGPDRQRLDRRPDRTPTRTGHRGPRPGPQAALEAHPDTRPPFGTPRAFAHVRARARRHEAPRVGIRPRGNLRHGRPSEWQAACMRHADELNKRDGIEVAA